MLNTTAYAAAQKANLEALLGLSAKALESVEKFAALNLQTAKATLDDAADATYAVQSAKTPQDLIALQAGWAQPSAEKVAAYGRRVADIVGASKVELEKFQAVQAAKLQSAFEEFVEAVTKNAPEASTQGLAMFKSAYATATNAIETVQKAARQATEVAQQQFTAATAPVATATRGKRG